MAHITGIGGVFFAAEDSDALSRWYADNLTITPPPGVVGASSWVQESGPTVYAPMARDSEPVRERGWSINFRVDDLDGMVAELRGRGIEVDVDPEPYPYGRFAQLRDPEGNPIQLWQPGD